MCRDEMLAQRTNHNYNLVFNQRPRRRPIKRGTYFNICNCCIVSVKREIVPTKPSRCMCCLIRKLILMFGCAFRPNSILHMYKVLIATHCRTIHDTHTHTLEVIRRNHTTLTQQRTSTIHNKLFLFHVVFPFFRVFFIFIVYVCY